MESSKQKGQNSLRAILLIGTGVLGVVFLLGKLGSEELLGWRIYDLGLKLRKSVELREVVVVGVTDQDLYWKKMPFPWPREMQAEVFEKISNEKPRVVAVELLYSVPSVDSADAELGRSLGKCDLAVGAFYFNPGQSAPLSDSDQLLLESSGNLLGSDLRNQRWTSLDGRAVLPVDSIANGFRRMGNTMSVPDRDGITRRILLLSTDGKRLYPALALQAILLYWGVDWSQVRATPWEISIVNVPEIGDVKIPLDGKGNFLIPFSGRADGQLNGFDIRTLESLDELRAQGNSPPELKDNLVFVGSLLSAHGDIFPTPVEAATAGTIINGITAGSILRQEFIRPIPAWTNWLITLVVLMVSCMLFFLRRPILSLFLGLFLGGVVLAGSLWLLVGPSIWISPVNPALTCFFCALAITTWSLVSIDRQRQETYNLLSRYLSPKLATALAEDSDTLNRPPKRRVLSVFSAKIVDYIETSEKLEAEDLISYLSQYYSKMTEIAHRHEGTVNKYLGAGMMVFFNDPFEQEDHEVRVIRMAVDMQNALEDLNTTFEKRGLPPVEVCMGISTGYATVGNIGREGFIDYTAIGPTVNLASRIMNLAGGGQIYVSEKTMLSVPPGEFESEDLGGFKFREVGEEVNVSSVFSIRS